MQYMVTKNEWDARYEEGLSKRVLGKMIPLEDVIDLLKGFAPEELIHDRQIDPVMLKLLTIVRDDLIKQVKEISNATTNT